MEQGRGTHRVTEDVPTLQNGFELKQKAAGKRYMYMYSKRQEEITLVMDHTTIILNITEQYVTKPLQFNVMLLLLISYRVQK